MSKDTIRGPGLKVELDSDQIFPNDPGQGTPVLVVFANEDTGTWNCVTTEGQTADGTRVTPEQSKWLDRITPRVEEWMRQNGV